MGHIVELEARDGGGRDRTAPHFVIPHPTRKAHKETPCVRTRTLHEQTQRDPAARDF